MAAEWKLPAPERLSIVVSTVCEDCGDVITYRPFSMVALSKRPLTSDQRRITLPESIVNHRCQPRKAKP